MARINKFVLLEYARQDGLPITKEMLDYFLGYFSWYIPDDYAYLKDFAMHLYFKLLPCFLEYVMLFNLVVQPDRKKYGWAKHSATSVDSEQFQTARALQLQIDDVIDICLHSGAFPVELGDVLEANVCARNGQVRWYNYSLINAVYRLWKKRLVCEIEGHMLERMIRAYQKEKKGGDDFYKDPYGKYGLLDVIARLLDEFKKKEGLEQLIDLAEAVRKRKEEYIELKGKYDINIS
jgi:hypothetical protein